MPSSESGWRGLQVCGEDVTLEMCLRGGVSISQGQRGAGQEEDGGVKAPGARARDETGQRTAGRGLRAKGCGAGSDIGRKPRF